MARLPSRADVPQAVRAYLQAEKLPERLLVTRPLQALDWSPLDVRNEGVAPDGDAVCTHCFAGVAEAGALVLLSGPEHPTELNFLAATHIVVLPVDRVVADFESLWALLSHDGVAADMPRMMNFIVGPSRTADLGVPSKLGAHGPARLHILLVND